MLLRVVDFLEIGVAPLVVARLAVTAGRGAIARTGTGARAGRAVAAGRRRLRLVHRLAELHRELGERIGLGDDRGGVLTGGGGAQFGDRRLDRALLGFRHLVAVFLDGALGGVDQRLRLVPGLDEGALLLV